MLSVRPGKARNQSSCLLPDANDFLIVCHNWKSSIYISHIYRLIAMVEVRKLIINLCEDYRCTITIIGSWGEQHVKGWKVFNVKQMYNVLTLH